MAGIGHRGFMGRNKGVIPVPQAGVCTVYPIPIPVTSGLIHYSSPFNWCDQYDDLAGTNPISPPFNLWNNSKDISSNMNPQLGGGGGARPMRYFDDGLGDVYWVGGGFSGSIRYSTVDVNWRLNTDVKTVIMLAKADDITSNVNTRLGFHYTGGVMQFNGSRLGLNTAGYMTNVLATSGVYHVLSCRTNNNCTMGVDKDYELVSASAPTISNTDFNLWSPNGANGGWGGDCRDVAIFDRAINDAELDTMVDYMKTKWNL